jgi:hypothetical protein
MKLIKFAYMGRRLFAEIDLEHKCIFGLMNCDDPDSNFGGIRVTTEADGGEFFKSVQKYLTDEGYFEHPELLNNE